jgi:hypothetical protein
MHFRCGAGSFGLDPLRCAIATNKCLGGDKGMNMGLIAMEDVHYEVVNSSRNQYVVVIAIYV